MKILMVTDQYYSANNGMTISARRFAQVLRSHGNEVRVASYGPPGLSEAEENAYLMNRYYVPIFDKLITSQGMVFAKPDRDLLYEAISWADVVHFLTPFTLSHVGIRIAQQLGTPFTAAFHVQPENITSSIHLAHVEWVNRMIYRWFRFYIYGHCLHVHCPSRFIAGELQKNKYSENILHVISNGIDPDFCPQNVSRPEKKPGDPFNILMVGRLSIEKRQDVLMRAIALSPYKNQIRLYLAGRGPREKHLRALAKELGLDVVFGFYAKDELLGVIGKADLYVHAASMEIEAMSCMEAFACGRVPVIADSPKSATPQFALDERSLFPAEDSVTLAKKIGWWIEHPKERLEMEEAYGQLGHSYELDACVRQAEEMFMQAVRESEEHVDPCTV